MGDESPGRADLAVPSLEAASTALGRKVGTVVLAPAEPAPLEFRGILLAHQSTKSPLPDPWFADRWFNFFVYLSSDRMLVLSISYDCRPKWRDEHDEPHHTVLECRTLGELSRRLEAHDFRRHIGVNYIPDGHICFVEGTERYVAGIERDVQSAIARLLQETEDTLARVGPP